MRPAGPAVAENTAQHQPPPPAGASSFASSDPHAIQTIVNLEEKKKQLQLMAPATINDDVAPPSIHQQEEQNLHQHLAGCQDPFSGVRLTPVQLQQPSQNWPIELLGHESQPPMHQVQSSSAFGSIGHAGTNPFDVVPPPLLPAFPPAPYRDPFAVSSALSTSTNDWTGSAPKFYLEVPPGFERLPNIPSKLVVSDSMIQEQRPVQFLEVPPGFERLNTKAEASTESSDDSVTETPPFLPTFPSAPYRAPFANSSALPTSTLEQTQAISSTTTEETEQDYYFLQGEKRIRLRGGDTNRSDDEERMEIERERLIPPRYPTDVEFSQGLEESIWKYVEEHGIGPRDAMSVLFWNDFIEYECPRIAIKSPYLMQTHFNQVMLKNLWEREMRRDSKAKLLRSLSVSVTAQQHAFIRRNDKRWLVLSTNGFVKRWMSTEEHYDEDDYEERVARYNKEPHLFTPPPKRRNRNDDGSEGVEREGARDNQRHRSPISPLEARSPLLSPTDPPARKRGRVPDARTTVRNPSRNLPYSQENVKKFLELLLRKLNLPNPPTLGSSKLFQEFVETIGESNGEQWRKQWGRTLSKTAFEIDMPPADILKVYKEYRIPLGENKKKMEEKFGVLITEKDGCIVDTRVNDDSVHIYLKDDTDEEWRKAMTEFNEKN
ncbi:hypothetical protein CAEBREN_18131 [Caenorhabditis brenneri]|uniref:Uncharacterized protein n=1 Tax=Caenorhabditis brenneri TaxID=135651 RepID=G0NEQ0_CAEBE|nr:hypothetical protein CAEBREN_18131 [Caenorhabditis brenneri]